MSLSVTFLLPKRRLFFLSAQRTHHCSSFGLGSINYDYFWVSGGNHKISILLGVESLQDNGDCENFILGYDFFGRDLLDLDSRESIITKRNTYWLLLLSTQLRSYRIEPEPYLCPRPPCSWGRLYPQLLFVWGRRLVNHRREVIVWAVSLWSPT